MQVAGDASWRDMGDEGEAWVSSRLTQDKWGDPLALPFPRQSLPPMETCSAKRQPTPPFSRGLEVEPQEAASPAPPPLLSFFPFSSFPPLSFFTSFLSISLPSFLLSSFPLSPICSRSLTRVYPPLILLLVPLQVPKVCSEQQDGQKPRDKPCMFPAGPQLRAAAAPPLFLF